jgi:hypothetical protein
METRRVLLTMVYLVALPALLLLGGCNIIAYAANAVPQKVDAKYTPPKTPILVLVENRQNPGILVTESDQLTLFVMDDLATYKVAPLIELKKLYELRDSQKNIDKMTITQIGKAVGAGQVLYVDLERLVVSESEGGVPVHSRLEATVHMVDVKTSKTTFPTLGQNWPISLVTPITTFDNSSNSAALREALLQSAGTSIGQLFHDYTVE